MKHGILAAVPVVLLLLVLLIPPPAQAQDSGNGATIAGTVVNGTTGEPVPAGLEVALHQQGQGEQTTATSTTGAGGRFQFEGVEVVPGWAYGISVRYQDVLYGKDVEPGAGRTIRPHLEVYETTRDDTVLQGISVSRLLASVDRKGQRIGAMEIVTVRNDGDRTYVPSPDPMDLLRFGLPPGARELQVRTGLVNAEVLQVDEGFGLTAPVPPGEHEVLFTYVFPYEQASYAGSTPVPYGAEHFRFLVPEDMVRIASPSLEGPRSVTIGSKEYAVLEGRGLERGATVEVTLSGLPMPSPVDRLERWAEGVPWTYAPPAALAVVAVVVVFFGLRRRSGQPA